MKKVFLILSSLISIIALTVASSASAWFIYQPKTPKCLAK